MVVISVRLCGHVHRGRAEPQFAARHSVAGVLSRQGQGQEADPLQPDQLAGAPDRRSAGALEGRQRPAAGHRCAHHPPFLAARPRRRGARHGAHDRPRPAARAGRQSLPRSHAGDDRRPADCTGLEAGDGEGARSGDRGARSRRRAGLGRGDEDELYTALDWLADASRRSRRRSPGATSRTARWCSTMSRPAIWRGAAAS